MSSNNAINRSDLKMLLQKIQNKDSNLISELLAEIALTNTAGQTSLKEAMPVQRVAKSEKIQPTRVIRTTESSSDPIILKTRIIRQTPIQRTQATKTQNVAPQTRIVKQVPAQQTVAPVIQRSVISTPSATILEKKERVSTGAQVLDMLIVKDFSKYVRVSR